MQLSKADGIKLAAIKKFYVAKAHQPAGARASEASCGIADGQLVEIRYRHGFVDMASDFEAVAVTSRTRGLEKKRSALAERE